MGRINKVTLELEPMTFEHLRHQHKLIFTHNGKTLTFSSDDANRGHYQSYPNVKIYAQNKEISLRAIASALGANYQGFVNACNGRARFKEQWKDAVANILGASRKEIFNED